MLAAIRLIVNWIAGTVIGTLIVALSSPLFIRSYVPLQVDAVRGVWTLPPDQVYRWRSEGYADTRIGPLGMPGRDSIPGDKDRSIRVALWGDSQAEGVCVSDQEKLFAQMESVGPAAPARSGLLSVFPLARSGEDASVWLTQMPAVEEFLSVDIHALLIVDLSDLLAAASPPAPPPSADDIENARSAIAAQLPAFVIQGARHLLTGPDGTTVRRLRFSIGPVEQEEHDTMQPTVAVHDWTAAVRAVKDSTDRVVVILYAPQLPQIAAGRVITVDPHGEDFQAMKWAAEEVGLIVVDLREPLLASMKSGRWPHGFDNGVIGSGHLNLHGYRVIARGFVDALPQVALQSVRQ